MKGPKTRIPWSSIGYVLYVVALGVFMAVLMAGPERTAAAVTVAWSVLSMLFPLIMLAGAVALIAWAMLTL